jgi:hypothetical protein
VFASALLGCVWLASCTVDQSDNPAYRGCVKDLDCDQPAHCRRGYCVPDPPSSSGSPDTSRESPLRGEQEPAGAGGATSRDASTAGAQGGAHSPAPDAAQSGPVSSMPMAGEGGSSGEASPPPPPDEQPVGACATGAEPSAESCNGEDDDCDGTSDELPVETCYPDKTSGCADDEGDGTWACMGACKVGLRSCERGSEGCAGAVVPASAETCTEAGMPAEDEDCDGRADEGCACTSDAQQGCFDGPRTAIGVGPCRAGMQMCSEGSWGACAGARLPQAETCANAGQDDDCNGARDDIARLGAECTAEQQAGRCRKGTMQCTGEALTCVPAAAGAETCDRSDEDCDGKTDEGFALQTDGANCGRCGNVCASGSACCGGRCVDVNEDAANCGRCGHACGEGESCCGGNCIDTAREPAHCGACDHACTGLLQACCEGVCKTLCLL